MNHLLGALGGLIAASWWVAYTFQTYRGDWYGFPLAATGTCLLIGVGAWIGSQFDD